jgi:hypothetical protein
MSSLALPQYGITSKVIIRVMATEHHVFVVLFHLGLDNVVDFKNTSQRFTRVHFDRDNSSLHARPQLVAQLAFKGNDRLVWCDEGGANSLNSSTIACERAKEW